MFNLNENNRFMMSRNPMDLRKGVDSLCGTVRSCAPDPLNGEVYVSSNRGRTALKLLHWERGGYTLYCRRLSVGRFHQGIFLREGVGFRSMRRDELVLLMDGISLGVARRKRYLRDSLPGGSVARKVEKKFLPISECLRKSLAISLNISIFMAWKDDLHMRNPRPMSGAWPSG